METKSYTGKDFYTSYCDYIEDNPLYQVDYKTFRGVINDYFKYLRDELIENGKEIKLPCRLGTLSVIKHKPKEYSGKNILITTHSHFIKGLFTAIDPQITFQSYLANGGLNFVEVEDGKIISHRFNQ